MSEPLPPCDRCGGEMFRLSEEGAVPLALKCTSCGHCQYAEFQDPPPWSPDDLEPEPTRRRGESRPRKGMEERFRLFDPSAVPVSTGSDEDAPVVPVGWILLWLILLGGGALILWLVF